LVSWVCHIELILCTDMGISSSVSMARNKHQVMTNGQHTITLQKCMTSCIKKCTMLDLQKTWKHQ